MQLFSKTLLKTLLRAGLGLGMLMSTAFAQIEGTASLSATINEYSGEGDDHWTVVWVTSASGTFIKTVWLKGPSVTRSHWNSHCREWYTQKNDTANGGNNEVDGYSSGSARNYSPPNSPVNKVWDCRDKNGALVADGDYKFWIQYAEDDGQGPYTTNGLLWTKGAAASSPRYSNQGSNFTNMSVTWEPVVPLEPEIIVEQPVGTDLADGGSRGFGSVTVGADTSLTFTIRNTGTADLTGLGITKTGANAADFTVTSSPAAPVSSGGGTTTFAVRFTPTAAGTRSATLHIASNDSDENPFDLNLAGTGIEAEIAVEQPSGTDLADGGSRGFGSVTVGADTSLTFTIRNTGTADLTGLGITKTGANAADFTVTSSPAAPVSSGGGTTTFAVRFTPPAAGTRSATLHIASNDSDENPFDLNLAGTGVTPFASWAATAGLPAGQDGPNDTPYGGQVTNLLKFASNLDPTTPSLSTLTVGAGGTTGLPDGQIVGRIIRVEFLRRKAGSNPGITYTPQFSGNLVDWTVYSGAEMVTSIDPTWERVVIDEIIPPGEVVRFARVLVTLDTPTGTGTTPFELWASAAGLPAGQDGPGDMPWREGVTNLMKFAFNLNAAGPDIRMLTVGAGDTAGLPNSVWIDRVFRFEFLRRKAGSNPGITYQPQFSGNLTTWTDHSDAGMVAPIDATWERVVIDDVLPPGATARFGRVMVILDP